MTGYAAHHPAIVEALALGRATYLSKPADITTLFRELRQALVS
jgi:ActR/RegA family two-component response regulator